MSAGTHAITLVSSSRGTAKKRDSEKRVGDFIWILEKLVRIHDQLDEQLHAGYYFYILTGTTKFVSNTNFIWPVVCLVFGVCLPFWLSYITYTEHNKVEWASRKHAYQFLALTYLLGGVIFMLPTWIIGDDRDTCLA